MWKSGCPLWVNIMFLFFFHSLFLSFCVFLCLFGRYSSQLIVESESGMCGSKATDMGSLLTPEVGLTPCSRDTFWLPIKARFVLSSTLLFS